MLILHPDCVTGDQGERFVVEDRSVKLTFSGDSADLCRQVLPQLAGAPSISVLAAGTSYSANSVARLLTELEGEGLAIDSPTWRNSISPVSSKRSDGVAVLEPPRHGAGVPAPAVPGYATRAEVLGWGLEFYFFILPPTNTGARRRARPHPHRNPGRLLEHY